MVLSILINVWFKMALQQKSMKINVFISKNKTLD